MQALIGAANDGIPAHCGDGRHVGDRADAGPSAPAAPSSAPRVGLSGVRCEANERGDGSKIRAAKFRHQGHHDARGQRPNTATAAENRVLLAQDGASIDLCVHPLLEIRDGLREPCEMCENAVPGLVRGDGRAVLLGRHHVDEVPPPVDEGSETLRLRCRQGARRRLRRGANTILRKAAVGSMSQRNTPADHSLRSVSWQ